MKVRSAVTLVGLAISFALPTFSQQVDLDAARRAKAAAGKEALSHGSAKVLAPVGTFVTFDAPGAGTGPGQGTSPSGINPAGAVTGFYYDANFVGHGFLRTSDGTFVKFDLPGAGTGAFQGTFPSSINPAGAVTGFYYDANFVAHGFVRAANGAFATFDAPQGSPIGIVPVSINPAGTIAGYYADANFVGHGFVRAAKGTLVSFDAPGAGTNFPGTYSFSINPAGTIVGIFTDAKNLSHGFVRASDGTFNTFDVPGQITPFVPFDFARPLYINPDGVITGTYFEFISGNPLGGNFRVFVRTPEGALTTFDAATYPPCCIWSFPSGITPAGAITGSFNDGFTINHGFLRAPDGTVTTFDAPGAGAGFNQGTAALGITPAGVIMGLYIDANYRNHGFLLRLPR